jgi:serine protease Do
LRLWGGLLDLVELVSSQKALDGVYCGVSAMTEEILQIKDPLDPKDLPIDRAWPVTGRCQRGGAWLRAWRRWALIFVVATASVQLLNSASEAQPGGIEGVVAEALLALPAPRVVNRSDLPEPLRRLVPVSVEQLKLMEKHIRELVARVSPTVVAVRVGLATGSGIVVSPDGLVLSAAHVGGEPGRDVLFMFPDGRTARGTTLGMDHSMDAGLMRITEPGPWPHAELGEPEGAMIGDWVLALGHPGGFDPERPVLVRLGRILWQTRPVIRTDCTLVSGDSGGPLFDMHGRVIGIHSRISESPAANFHAPISSYITAWDRLARSESWGLRGPSSRSWVGVRGTDHPEGFRLERVIDGGPAFRAGLRDGDIITRINGEPIPDSDSFTEAVSQTRPGEQLTLEVQRAAERWNVEVTVEARRRGGRPFGGR